MEAEIANRIKSEFISNMSHELRTPLNTVIGFSKLLTEHDRRPFTGEEVVEYASLIHDASCNLLAIINDILEISKIQSGHYRLDTVEFNLDEVLGSVVTASNEMAADAGVTLLLDIGDAAIPVRGDARKLRRVFVNLVGNAIKFSSAGCHVVVSCSIERDGGISIMVRDDGVGMNDEEIEIALSPFGQVDGARTRWREGTGLGLPIAKALVELHGGALTIRSEKDVGTEVLVRLQPPEFLAFMQNDWRLDIAGG